MKIKRLMILMLISIGLLSTAACSAAPYNEDSIFTGTIEGLTVKEKFLFDDQLLLIKEDNGDYASLYEIPVDNFQDYEVGQRVKVVVFSNTDADVWDLNHLKFEITIIE
jgi:hypothetical protein